MQSEGALSTWCLLKQTEHEGKGLSQGGDVGLTLNPNPNPNPNPDPDLDSDPDPDPDLPQSDPGHNLPQSDPMFRHPPLLLT